MADLPPDEYGFVNQHGLSRKVMFCYAVTVLLR